MRLGVLSSKKRNQTRKESERGAFQLMSYGKSVKMKSKLGKIMQRQSTVIQSPNKIRAVKREQTGIH